jgi:hypothetical protein
MDSDEPVKSTMPIFSSPAGVYVIVFLLLLTTYCIYNIVKGNIVESLSTICYAMCGMTFCALLIYWITTLNQTIAWIFVAILLLCGCSGIITMFIKKNNYLYNYSYN